MDIRDIKKLVLEGETDTLEFKKKANFPEKIVKEIVAFANTRGGRLLIGVDDDSTVTGVKYYEEGYIQIGYIEQMCNVPIIANPVETNPA